VTRLVRCTLEFLPLCQQVPLLVQTMKTKLLLLDLLLRSLRLHKYRHAKAFQCTLAL
jgi:hypothetical protein